MGQESGHVNLVEWRPSSFSPATEGQQLGSLLNAPLSVSSWTQSATVWADEVLRVFFVKKRFFTLAAQRMRSPKNQGHWR
jgi:hypothetical protein